MIDTHAHLNDEILYPKIGEILTESKQKGISKIVCSSYDLPSSFLSVKIAQENEMVYATVGIHPENSKYYDDKTEEELKSLCQSKKVVAFGEIGLDYHYDTTESPKEIQKQVFERQLVLADSLNLPVVVHTRDAIGDTLQIIKNNLKYINNGLVFHCYNASREVTKILLNYGFKFSFGGSITFHNNNIVDVIKELPTDSYFLETDCPYLAPQKKRGQTNVPQNVVLVAEFLQELLGKDLKEIERYTDKNANDFFHFSH